ncbi:MAG: alpha/beta fold hydrolase [Clostridiales Family XIII bacterium]|jgi:2-hydroxymuconate-semialdehyde hydrolase|nr:alpha/beta fold hydrolase [Clostridiales Family XIII bacterium]
MAKKRPEIANSIRTGGYNTNYHDVGKGKGGDCPLVMLHGSGPGASAYGVWGRSFPLLGKTRRIVAPDVVGFGYTDRPEGIKYGMDVWVEQVINLLDALKIKQADLIGNSFGGALVLAMAVRYPKRVHRIVLMCSMGTNFPITYGLDRVWGYEPSVENMRELLGIFSYDHGFINDDVARARYEASIQPGFQESFRSMFPAPRQDSVAAIAGDEAYLNTVKQPALILHGREDRVVPLQSALDLARVLENPELHVFGKCGHWVQAERTEDFCLLAERFLSKK